MHAHAHARFCFLQEGASEVGGAGAGDASVHTPPLTPMSQRGEGITSYAPSELPNQGQVGAWAQRVHVLQPTPLPLSVQARAHVYDCGCPHPVHCLAHCHALYEPHPHNSYPNLNLDLTHLTLIITLSQSVDPGLSLGEQYAVKLTSKDGRVGEMALEGKGPAW